MLAASRRACRLLHDVHASHFTPCKSAVTQLAWKLLESLTTNWYGQLSGGVPPSHALAKHVSGALCGRYTSTALLYYYRYTSTTFLYYYYYTFTARASRAATVNKVLLVIWTRQYSAVQCSAQTSGLHYPLGTYIHEFKIPKLKNIS